MKKMLMTALAVMSLSLAGAAQSGTVGSFTGLVGFGDSLMDGGRLDGFLAPPSLDGRFSDGPTWFEVLSDKASGRGIASVNMALGGATAGPVNLNDGLYAAAEATLTRDPGDPNDIPFLKLSNFDAQITSFLNAGFDAVVGANPLVVLSFGGNDLLQGVVSPGDALAAISNGIQRLANAPTGYTNFLVANLPNGGLSPGVPFEDKIAAGLATFGVNLALQNGVVSPLNAVPGLHVETFDVFNTFNLLTLEAVLAGLRLDVACTESLTSEDALNPVENRCLVPGTSQNFLFVDDVHPGAFVHAGLGAAAFAQIEDRLPAPIPVPAGLPLLLTGFGALLLARRAV